MSKPFDYSKWDNIELSDDEEDVHPNIDRESWFRMKHRSRVEREEHEDKDKKRIKDEVSVPAILGDCEKGCHVLIYSNPFVPMLSAMHVFVDGKGKSTYQDARTRLAKD